MDLQTLNEDEFATLHPSVKKYIADDLDPDSRKLIDSLIYFLIFIRTWIQQMIHLGDMDLYNHHQMLKRKKNLNLQLVLLKVKKIKKIKNNGFTNFK